MTMSVLLPLFVLLLALMFTLINTIAGWIVVISIVILFIGFSKFEKTSGIEKWLLITSMIITGIVFLSVGCYRFWYDRNKDCILSYEFCDKYCGLDGSCHAKCAYQFQNCLDNHR